MYNTKVIATEPGSPNRDPVLRGPKSPKARGKVGSSAYVNQQV